MQNLRLGNKRTTFTNMSPTKQERTFFKSKYKIKPQIQYDFEHMMSDAPAGQK